MLPVLLARKRRANEQSSTADFRDGNHETSEKQLLYLEQHPAVHADYRTAEQRAIHVGLQEQLAAGEFLPETADAHQQADVLLNRFVSVPLPPAPPLAFVPEWAVAAARARGP